MADAAAKVMERNYYFNDERCHWLVPHQANKPNQLTHTSQ